MDCQERHVQTSKPELGFVGRLAILSLEPSPKDCVAISLDFYRLIRTRLISWCLFIPAALKLLDV